MKECSTQIVESRPVLPQDTVRKQVGKIVDIMVCKMVGEIVQRTIRLFVQQIVRWTVRWTVVCKMMGYKTGYKMVFEEGGCCRKVVRRPLIVCLRQSSLRVLCSCDDMVVTKLKDNSDQEDFNIFYVIKNDVDFYPLTKSPFCEFCILIGLE